MKAMASGEIKPISILPASFDDHLTFNGFDPAKSQFKLHLTKDKEKEKEKKRKAKKSRQRTTTCSSKINGKFEHKYSSTHSFLSESESTFKIDSWEDSMSPSPVTCNTSNNPDRSKKEYSESSINGERKQSRYWTEEEHQRFLRAIDLYGPKDVKAISAEVGTRSPTQVRTHSQKYFLRLQREQKRREEQHHHQQQPGEAKVIYASKHSSIPKEKSKLKTKTEEIDDGNDDDDDDDDDLSNSEYVDDRRTQFRYSKSEGQLNLNTPAPPVTTLPEFNPMILNDLIPLGSSLRGEHSFEAIQGFGQTVPICDAIGDNIKIDPMARSEQLNIKPQPHPQMDHMLQRQYSALEPIPGSPKFAGRAPPPYPLRHARSAPSVFQPPGGPTAVPWAKYPEVMNKRAMNGSQHKWRVSYKSQSGIEGESSTPPAVSSSSSPSGPLSPHQPILTPRAFGLEEYDLLVKGIKSTSANMENFSRSRYIQHMFLPNYSLETIEACIATFELTIAMIEAANSAESNSNFFSNPNTNMFNGTMEPDPLSTNLFDSYSPLIGINPDAVLLNANPLTDEMIE